MVSACGEWPEESAQEGAQWPSEGVIYKEDVSFTKAGAGAPGSEAQDATWKLTSRFHAPCPELVPTRFQGRRSNCPQLPSGAPLLTLLLRHPRGHLGELLARRLRLLGVEVLGLGLLATRHGARMRHPAGLYEWPTSPSEFPEFGNYPQLSRKAQVPAILLTGGAGRFIQSPDG